jgi:hypothetical protein
MTALKALALSSLLVLAAGCASSDSIPNEVMDCGPGQDLEIRAGLADPKNSDNFGQYVFLVEVANNSHEDVTVKRVRIDPRPTERYGTRSRPLNGAVKTYDETIVQGTEHVFELPSTASGLTAPDARDAVQPGEYELVVTVLLTNGETYRCPFLVQTRN